MNKCQILTAIIIQMGILAIYATLTDFQIGGIDYRLFYPQLMDLVVMVFVGFALIKVFLRNHTYTSIAYSIFLAAWSAQITILLRGAWFGAWDRDEMFDGDGNFFINIESIAHAFYGAATMLIAFGAILGKVNAFQLFIFGLFGIFFYTLNYAIAQYELFASDLGGAVLIHLFGACFGLAASFALGRKDWVIEPHATAFSRHSILYAIIGTLFLICYFPSFNGLFAILHTPATQELVFINTFLAIFGSIIMAFLVSALVNHGKFYMEDILYATFAGGVIVAAGAAFSQQPYACILAGNVAGALCVLSQKFATKWFFRHLKTHDTSGTVSAHLIPGFLGGFFVMITLEDSESNYARVFSGNVTDGHKQGDQVAMIFITMGIALASGYITGKIMKIGKIFGGPSKKEELFDDKHHFVLASRGIEEVTMAHSEHSNYYPGSHNKNHNQDLKGFVMQQIENYHSRFPDNMNAGHGIHNDPIVDSKNPISHQPHQPALHNPVQNNPVSHNPVSHNHNQHNPVLHNPGQHNPVQHNPNQNINTHEQAMIVPEQPGINQPMAIKQGKALPV